jgi:sigma-B regulation protein RsbU (phosphoserine phosphatase)
LREKPRLNKLLFVIFKLVVYLLIYSVFYIFSATFFSTASPFLAFLFTMLLVITNRGKLTDQIQKAVDKSFYRDLYKFKKSASQLERELSSTLDLNEELRNCIKFFKDQFGADQFGFFFLYDDVLRQIYPEPLPNAEFYLQLTPQKAYPDWWLNLKIYSVGKLVKEYSPPDEFLKYIHENPKYEVVIPLVTQGQFVGFVAFTECILHLLAIPEMNDYVKEIFERISASLDNARAHWQVRRKSLENELFLQIVKNISSRLNVSEVLEKMLENLSLLVKYDAAMIALVDEEKMVLRHMVSKGYSPEAAKTLSLKIGQGLVGWAIQQRQGFVTPDVSQAAQYFPGRVESRSQITVPIIVNDKAIGALALESNELNHFTRQDLVTLTHFADLAAVALRNAQLYEDSLKKQYLESQLLVASRVQQALLPKRVPVVKNLCVEVINVPSQIVGGDLYDAFRIDENREALAIGDVSGKGAPGAILMAVAYAGFKSLFNGVDPPATVVAKLNKLLYDVTATGYYVTFFFAELDCVKRELTYCNAGHNPPMIVRTTGEVVNLSDGGIVLGFLGDQTFKQSTAIFEPGDLLVCYTDGVTEAMNQYEEEYGEERFVELLQTVADQPLKQIKSAILESIEKFTGSKEFADDVTLLLARIET